MNTATKQVLRLDAEQFAMRRQLAGFTQVTFAKATGSTQAYISRLERGRANASVKKIKRFAETLDCDVEDITKFVTVAAA